MFGNNFFRSEYKIIPTHNVGHFAIINPHAKSQISRQIAEDIHRILWDDYFPYKPFNFNFQCSDFFVSLNDWDSCFSFHLWIQGSFYYDMLVEIKSHMSFPPQDIWFGNNAQAGCTFAPKTFYVLKYCTNVNKDFANFLGLPYGDECWKYWDDNNLRESNYWSNVPRWDGQ